MSNKPSAPGTPKIVAPRTSSQATALLGRYAETDAALAEVEADRKVQIGRVNADADVYATPLLAERAGIVAAMEPWWAASGQALAGTRKSVQLGGCMIGTRTRRASLAHGFGSDDKAVEALRAGKYGKQTTRVAWRSWRTFPSRCARRTDLPLAIQAAATSRTRCWSRPRASFAG